MKGLELCRTYFFEHGLPMLEAEFPHLLDRMAAGLVGDGSDCFGYDDHISRDHDWGPGFCLWLSKEDYYSFGAGLSAAMDRLPKSFMGFGPRLDSQWGQGRVGAFSTPDFYTGFIGMDRLPSGLDDWLHIPESALAACTNGAVFMDRGGEFSSWRDFLLNYYPEDVRLKKIASRCMTVAQSGQYNYPRCLKRGDLFSAQYSLVKFCSDFMSLVFLLNRRYSPFYKWMHKAVGEAPVLGVRTKDSVSRLMDSSGHAGKEDVVEELCRLVILELKNQELTDDVGDFLADHGPRVQKRIRDSGLASRNVWVG